ASLLCGGLLRHRLPGRGLLRDLLRGRIPCGRLACSRGGLLRRRGGLLCRAPGGGFRGGSLLRYCLAGGRLLRSRRLALAPRLLAGRRRGTAGGLLRGGAARIPGAGRCGGLAGCSCRHGGLRRWVTEAGWHDRHSGQVIPPYMKRGLSSCCQNTCSTRGAIATMNSTPYAAPARCALWLTLSPPRRSIQML